MHVFVCRVANFEQMVERRMEKKDQERRRLIRRRSVCWLSGWEHILCVTRLRNVAKAPPPEDFLLIGVIRCEACAHNCPMQHNEAVLEMIVVF